MASFVYNKGAEEIANGTIDWVNNTLVVMLVTSSYTADRDDDVVDAGGANDPVDHEIVATDYTRGWGGAGRKALANKSITEVDASDRVEFDADDLTGGTTWSGIGNGANAAIAAAIVIKEGGANDTTSRLIAYLDTNNLTTNNSDVDLTFDASGVFYLSTA